MSNFINISEATSIALHGLALIVKNHPNKMNVKSLAEHLEASPAHLAKVFQKLSKADIVTSSRGPAGGFILSRPAEEITFLEIYEVMEGKVNLGACPLGRTVCTFSSCIFTSRIHKITKELYDEFKSIKLSDFQ